MSTNYEATPRACAAGVTTASVLVVMLAMAASTLFTTSAPAPASMAGHESTVQIVRSQSGGQIHQSRS